MAITDAIIEQYQHPRIKLVVGSTTIYEDDIVSGSFNYRGGTSGGGAFAPGGCVVSSCSFAVYNRTGAYTNLFTEGTEIEVYIGYGATAATATYDLLCTVYASDITKRNYKVSVKAYDKLRNADKKRWTTYSFPMTVNTIIQSAATEAGITVDTLPASGGTISVDLRDDDGNQPDLQMTCRQAIAQALLISGNFGYMTAAGALYCGWYNTTASKTIPNNWLMDYSVSDEQDYTGVQVYGQTPTGSTTRLYVLSSGSFVTEDNCAAIQSRLYDALIGVNVRIGSFTILCNPNIKPGDVVQIAAPQAGSTLSMTIPLMTVVIKGSLRATYSTETVTTDEADDLRASDEKTTEDVARGDYATKDWVNDAIKKGSGGTSNTIHALIELSTTVGKVKSSDTFTGLSISPNGITALQASTAGYDCQILRGEFSIPTYEAIENMMLKGDEISDFKFPVRLKVRSMTHNGFIDFVGCYTTAGAGLVVQLSIAGGKGQYDGNLDYGGNGIFTKVLGSELLIIPFRITNNYCKLVTSEALKNKRWQAVTT